MESLRKEWFNWVAKTRKKMVRVEKKPVTHRAAMKAAALTWGKEKLKILNRRKREERKKLKDANKIKPPSEISREPVVSK